MDALAWVSVAVVALVAVGCAGVALWSVRRSLSLEDRLRDDASAALAKGKADFAQLAESVEEMIEEARNQRRRANGAKGGRPPREPDPNHAGPAITREAYLAHVERTGRSDPEVERALGL